MTAPYEIVAAAPGTVRFIVDSFSEARPGQSPCNNNYVWIEHANGEWTKYSHMTQNSTTEDAGLTVGDTVDTGEFLGYEDDVGCASGNHLHWEVGVPANPADPIDSQGFLRGGSAENLIPRICGIPNQRFVAGTTYFAHDLEPGASEYSLHGVPESSYQAEWARAKDCGYRLVWLDGYTDDGDLEFNLIFRTNTAGVAWRSYRKMSGSKYQQRFNEAKADGYRLVHVDSYAYDGEILYGAIFDKASGPKQVAYHGLTTAQHEDRLDELVADGYRPRIITPASLGSNRRVTALYQKRSVGSWEARSFLSPSEYQSKYNANKSAGRRLVYVNAYTHGGSPKIAAIWWKEPAASIRAKHGLTSSQYQDVFEDNLDDGYLTQAVAGYQQGSGVRYIAFWAK